MTTQTLERPEETGTTPDDDPAHIVCLCRPHVAFCGFYDTTPVTDDDWDEDEVCPDCFHTLTHHGCPGCGCAVGQRCTRCEDPK